VTLPAKRSVEQILEEYLRSQPEGDMHAVELCNGLREYFNRLLGSQLLYRHERKQYEELKQVEKYMAFPIYHHHSVIYHLFPMIASYTYHSYY
jgi:hypothetical protein